MQNVGIFYDHFDYSWPFGITYGRLVSCVVIWYIFPILVCFLPEKSGNPGLNEENERGLTYLWTIILISN
jgi:hypothetical protein